MNQRVVLITGAAGFLGSALCVDLSRDHCVVAVDRRKPSGFLRGAAPGAIWHQVDIGDGDALARTFGQARRSLGPIDGVLHFAAFYHFGADWREEYSRTNLEGTRNVLRSAQQNGARGIIFASSVAAMEPPAPGAALTEKTPATGRIPYARSKSAGEELIRDAAPRLPGVVLRIGGAFSDWCELPPLATLIGLWAGRSLLSRVLVGRGASGIPYIHRHDVIGIVRCCMEARETLDPYEVFFASQRGVVTHEALFAAMHRGIGNRAAILIPQRAAGIGLRARLAIGAMLGRAPFERPWMMNYVDRPWVVDTTYTRDRLGWSCSEGMGLMERLPTMLDHFTRQRRTWEDRNRLRMRGLYSYCG